MGAYLAVPVTAKERFEGQGGLPGMNVVYGGAAMQGWRRTMEDAHLAQVSGTSPEPWGMFGVFDGHGGSEVALFCQRYMATELQKLEAFGVDAVEDALVDVFHRMDDMLRDHTFADEIEQLKARDAAEEDEGKGEDDGVSPMDALEMIKRVFQLKRFMGEGGEGGPGGSGAADEAIAMDDDEDEGPSASGAAEGGALQRRRQQAGGNGDSAAANGEQRQQAGARGGSGSGGAGNGSAAAPPWAAQRAEQQEDSGDPGPGSEQQQQRFIEPADARIQAGCTAVVAVIKGGHLYVANAGDSRGVLCRGGTAVAMSEDHKPAQETERTRILNAGGFLSEIGGVCRVNGNLNLSRAIGDLKYKTNRTLEAKDQIITAQPDVRKVALQPEDEFFLLACDGVWDVMTNQDAVDFVRERLRQGAAPTDVSCQLLDACLASDPKEARGVGCDNMTAIVVQLRREGSSGGGATAKGAAQE